MSTRLTSNNKNIPLGVPAPTFQWQFLLPKFWLTWLMISFLYLLSWLPMAIQLHLGSAVGLLLHRFMKKRRAIAKRNLELCFPNMTENEIDQLVLTNYKNTGIAMFESGMAWWWPKWRTNNKVHIKGLENIDKPRSQGKGILLLFTHVLCLEMMGPVLGRCHPAIGFYRPHNNKLIEWVQYHGRIKFNRYMIGKKDVKGLLKALNDGEVCVYLPDHDYGRNRSVFVPFFAVEEAATTTGTEIFAGHKNAVTIPTKIKRLPGTQGYQLEFLKPLQDYPSADQEKNARQINAWVEEAVSDNMEQYMWVHRRFKTRPDKNDPSLY